MKGTVLPVFTGNNWLYFDRTHSDKGRRDMVNQFIQFLFPFKHLSSKEYHLRYQILITTWSIVVHLGQKKFDIKATNVLF
jgi:hypothetical protein